MSTGSKDDDKEKQKNHDNKFSYHFEKELIERQNKHVHLSFDTFMANKKVPPIATKFYSKYETNWNDNNTMQRFEHVFKNHKDEYDVPRSTNQMYGWLPKHLRGLYDPKDLNVIVAPKIRCDLTIYQDHK